MTAIVVRHENVLSIFEIPIGDLCISVDMLHSAIPMSHFALLAGLGSSDAKACVALLLKGIVGI